MNEKKIIEGKYNYVSILKKILIITSCCIPITGIIYVFANSMRNNSTDAYWAEFDKDNTNDDILAKCIDEADFWYAIQLPAMILCIAAIIIAIILLIDFLLIKNTELIVTDKRVYGRTLWGKSVDLPLDSISAIGTTISILKGISVSTSSGKILFLGIDNISDIHKEISKLLIDRQNNNSNNTPIQTSSNNNMDDIIKLKEMLDADIITQEEFDIKKKELLGL